MQITPELVARFPRPGQATPGRIAFRPDGAAVTYLWSPRGDLARELWELDLATGTRKAIFAADGGEAYSREEQLRRERERLRETGVTHYAWAAEANTLLVTMRGNAYVNGALAAEGASVPQLSRDGRVLAYVRDGELWAGDRRLTFDAAPGVTNGLADYLAQEEMHRHAGFWISADAQLIAFEQADARHIPIYPIVHQGKERVEIEEHRYPFAGEPNPKVRLGVVPVGGGSVVWMDLAGAEYLARVAWHPDGRLFVQTQTRDQRRLELRAYDPRTGRGRTLVTEESRHWVNLHNDLRFLESGEFVWASERTGLKQLYLYREDRLVRPLTSGPAPVDGVTGLSRTHIFFAAPHGAPHQRRILCAPLEGGPAVPLGDKPGWYDAVFSRDGSRYVEFYESCRRSPTVAVRAIEGGAPLVLHESPAPVDLPVPEIVSFQARDGETLYGALYRPARLPAPLVVSVYGGPHVQMVQDTWAETVDLRAQYLAQRGFLVLKVDNRGSSRRGLAFEGAVDGNLGDLEVRDQVDGVRYVQSLKLVDGDRVGIYGWSYGGYMTLMALCRAPETFKVGVAGAPVTSWDGYDTHYTERYMRAPEANPEGYRTSSVMTHLGGLTGKLLVIHGMLDENVHFRHTARLIHALLEINKPHDVLVYPEERHMPRSERGRAAMEARVAEYFERHL